MEVFHRAYCAHSVIVCQGMIHMMNIEKILNRVGEIINSNKNQDIASALGVPANVCSQWKRADRQTIPFDKIVDFGIKKNISINYLLIGEGDKYLKPNPEKQNKPDNVVQELLDTKNELIKSKNEQIDDLREQIEYLKKTYLQNKRRDDSYDFSPEKLRNVPGK